MFKAFYLLVILFLLVNCDSYNTQEQVTLEDGSIADQVVLEDSIQKEEALKDTSRTNENDPYDGFVPDFKFGSIDQLKVTIALIDTLILHNQGKLIFNTQAHPDSAYQTFSERKNLPDHYFNLITFWEYDDRRYLAFESPFAESGDFHIEYRHLFDESGNTVAFKKYTGFFQCLAKDDISQEHKTIFYDIDFNIIAMDSSFVNLTDSTTTKEQCINTYDYPYEIARSLEKYVERLD